MRIDNFITVFVLLLIGCTEKIEPISYNYTEVFTGKVSKTWKLERVTLRESGKSERTINYSACKRDDLYTFYANEEKEFKVTNGPLACQGQGAELLTYTWEFNQGNATLNMVLPNIFGYFIYPLVIKKITSNRMELEIYYNEEATVSQVLEFKLIDEE